MSTQEEWLAARRDLLEAEKEHFRYLDVAPLGRNEEGAAAGWWRRHDEYDDQTGGS